MVLRSSSGTNHVLNEHEDVCLYGPFTIPSEMSFTATLQVGELTQKHIKLSSQWAHYVFNEYTNFDL